MSCILGGGLIASSLSAVDLRTLACGDSEVNITLLKAHTKVCCQGPSKKGKEVTKWFWEVLKEFDASYRGKFLRFVCGRSKLPLSWSHPSMHERDYEPARDFELLLLSDSSALESAADDAMFFVSRVEGTVDDRLPFASTCFFSLKLPLYSSKKILKDKLMLAVNVCTAIDLDRLSDYSGGSTEES
eukprot:GHVR01049017.1.p1 GENE.GHVR01049017.1~~GHVR01049017.1.p1  ORF type:complete len:186 (-),score=38.98 GHVR01049017.1:395-952(-)